MARLLFALLPASVCEVFGQPDVIEFEVEGPVGPGAVMAGGPPPELLRMLGMGPTPSGHEGKPGTGGDKRHREQELDRALGEFLHVAAAANKKGPGLQSEEFVVEGPDGSELVLQGSPFGGSKSSTPVNFFQDLFPGPLAIAGPAEIDAADVTGFGGPDPLVMDMLQEMGRDFQEQVLPAIHAAGAQAGRNVPDACGADVKKHCSSARSQLHCLGQHAGDVSEKCRHDVDQSVPFLCSGAIDKYCDVLHSGILSCLEGHTQDLDGSCKDSILATRQAIRKVWKRVIRKGRKKASLVQLGATATQGLASRAPQTGAARAHPHSMHSTPSRSPASLEATHQQSRYSWLSSSVGLRIAFMIFLLVAVSTMTWMLLDAAAGRHPKGPTMWLRAQEGVLRNNVELPKSCEAAV